MRAAGQQHPALPWPRREGRTRPASGGLARRWAGRAQPCLSRYLPHGLHSGCVPVLSWYRHAGVSAVPQSWHSCARQQHAWEIRRVQLCQAPRAMPPARVACRQQGNSTLPCHGQSGRAAPAPRAAAWRGDGRAARSRACPGTCRTCCTAAACPCSHDSAMMACPPCRSRGTPARGSSMRGRFGACRGAMPPARVACGQQGSSTLPCRGQGGRAAPAPRAAAWRGDGRAARGRACPGIGRTGGTAAACPCSRGIAMMACPPCLSRGTPARGSSMRGRFGACSCARRLEPCRRRASHAGSRAAARAAWRLPARALVIAPPPRLHRAAVVALLWRTCMGNSARAVALDASSHAAGARRLQAAGQQHPARPWPKRGGPHPPRARRPGAEFGGPCAAVLVPVHTARATQRLRARALMVAPTCRVRRAAVVALLRAAAACVRDSARAVAPGASSRAAGARRRACSRAAAPCPAMAKAAGPAHAPRAAAWRGDGRAARSRACPGNHRTRHTAVACPCSRDSTNVLCPPCRSRGTPARGSSMTHTQWEASAWACTALGLSSASSCQRLVVGCRARMGAISNVYSKVLVLYHFRCRGDADAPCTCRRCLIRRAGMPSHAAPASWQQIFRGLRVGG